MSSQFPQPHFQKAHKKGKVKTLSPHPQESLCLSLSLALGCLCTFILQLAKCDVNKELKKCASLTDFEAGVAGTDAAAGGGAEQDVLGLQVPVDDALAVQDLHSPCDLLQEHADGVLTKGAFSCNTGKSTGQYVIGARKKSNIQHHILSALLVYFLNT